MSDRLETIVIGFGGIAQGLANDPLMARYFPYATHAQVLRAHRRFFWSAVVDPAESARAEARKTWGIAETAADISGIASPERFSIATISSPSHTRLALLDKLPGLRGIIVEKPLGLNPAEGRTFVEACRERGIEVQVNFWRRGDETLSALRQRIIPERIGRVQAAFGVYGNGLFNNGSHLIDLVRMSLGEVVWAQALGRAGPAHGPFRDDFHAPFALGLDAGLVFAAQPLDFREYREVGLDVWGTTGRLQITQEGLVLMVHPRRANRGLLEADEVASDVHSSSPPTVAMALYRMYDNLAAVVVGSEAPFSSGENALITDAVLHAIARSARDGQCRVELAARRA